MKNELSKEDQERISKRSILYTTNPFTNISASFAAGAIYEHPIAKKEGFNEAIEEAVSQVKLLLVKNFGLQRNDQLYYLDSNQVMEEIMKLKK